MSKWRLHKHGSSRWIDRQDGVLIASVNESATDYVERLLVAAPDLMHFLSAMIQSWDSGKRPEPELVRDARALIAQVTGGVA